MNRIFTKKWTKTLAASALALLVAFIVFALEFAPTAPDIGAINFSVQNGSVVFDQMGVSSVTFSFQLDAPNQSGADAFVWVYYGKNNVDSIYFYDGKVDSFVVPNGRSSVTKTINFTRGMNNRYTLYFVPPTGLNLLGMTEFEIETVKEDVYFTMKADKKEIIEGDTVTFTIQAVDSLMANVPLFNNRDTTRIICELNDIQALYTDKSLTKQLVFEVPPNANTATSSLKVERFLGAQWAKSSGALLVMDKPKTTIELKGGMPEVIVRDNGSIAVARLSQPSGVTVTKPGKLTPFCMIFEPKVPGEKIYSNPMQFLPSDFTSIGGNISGELVVAQNLSGCSSYIYQQSDWKDAGSMTLTLNKILDYGLLFDNGSIQTSIVTDIEPYRFSIVGDTEITEGQSFSVVLKADDVFGVSKPITVMLSGKAIPGGHLVREIDFFNGVEQVVFSNNIDTKLGEQAWGIQTVTIAQTSGVSELNATYNIKDLPNLTYFNLEFAPPAQDSFHTTLPAGRSLPILISIDSNRSLVTSNNSDSVFVLPINCYFSDGNAPIMIKDSVVFDPRATQATFVYTIPSIHQGRTQFDVNGGGLDGVMAKTNPSEIPVVESTTPPTLSVAITARDGTKSVNVDMDGQVELKATISAPSTSDVEIPLLFDQTRFVVGTLPFITIPAGQQEGVASLTTKFDWAYNMPKPVEIMIGYDLDFDYYPSEPAPVVVNITPITPFIVNTYVSYDNKPYEQSIKIQEAEEFKLKFISEPIKNYVSKFGNNIQMIAEYTNADLVLESTTKVFTLTYDAVSGRYVSNEATVTAASNDYYVPDQYVIIGFQSASGGQGSSYINKGSTSKVQVASKQKVNAIISVLDPIREDEQASYVGENQKIKLKVELDNHLQSSLNAAIKIVFTDTSFISELKTANRSDTIIIIPGYQKAGTVTLTTSGEAGFQGKRFASITVADDESIITKDPLVLGLLDSPRSNMKYDLPTPRYAQGGLATYEVKLDVAMLSNTPVEAKIKTSSPENYNTKVLPSPQDKVVTISKTAPIARVDVAFVDPLTGDFYGAKEMKLSFDNVYADSYGYAVLEKTFTLMPKTNTIVNLIPSSTTIYEEGTLRLSYALENGKLNLSGKDIKLYVDIPKEYFVNVPDDNKVEIIIKAGENSGYSDLKLTADVAEKVQIAEAFPQATQVLGLLVNTEKIPLTVCRDQAQLSFAKDRADVYAGMPYTFEIASSKTMVRNESFNLKLDPDIWGIASYKVDMKINTNVSKITLTPLKSAVEGTTIEIAQLSPPFTKGAITTQYINAYKNIPRFEWLATSGSVKEGSAIMVKMRYIGGKISQDKLTIPMMFSGSLPMNSCNIEPRTFVLPATAKPGYELTMNIKTIDNQVYEPDYFMTITPFVDVDRYEVPTTAYNLTIKEKNNAPSMIAGVGFTSVLPMNVIPTQTVMKSFAVTEPTLITFTISGKDVSSDDFDILNQKGELIHPTNNTYVLDTSDGTAIYIDFKRHMFKKYVTKEVKFNISLAKNKAGERLELDRYMRSASVVFHNISPSLTNDYVQYSIADVQTMKSSFTIHPLNNDDPAAASDVALSQLVISGIREAGKVTFDSSIVLGSNKLRLFIKDNNKAIGVDTTAFTYMTNASTVFIEYEVVQSNGGSSIATIELFIAPISTQGASVNVTSPVNTNAWFTSTPKMYGTYYDLIKDPLRKKLLKMSLKSLTRPTSSTPTKSVDVLMGKVARMYDKSALAKANKMGLFTKDTLDKVQNPRVGVNFYSDIKIQKLKTRMFYTSVVIRSPLVDTFIVPTVFTTPIVNENNVIIDDTRFVLDKSSTIGFKITGAYFGKAPKAYLEYSTGNQVKRIALPMMKSYKDQFGKKIILPVATSYNDGTHYWVKLPKTLPKGISGRIDLIIDTQSTLGGMKDFPYNEIKAIKPF